MLRYNPNLVWQDAQKGLQKKIEGKYKCCEFCDNNQRPGKSAGRKICTPLQIQNGEAVAPDRPGHGVAFNWQALAEHEVMPQQRKDQPV